MRARWRKGYEKPIPQTFVPNIYKAKASDFRTATMRIHHSKSQPSSITFGVLPSDAPVVP